MLVRSFVRTGGIGRVVVRRGLSTMPNNLKLATEEVMVPEPEPLIAETDYYFGTVDVPTSIAVHSFGVPGTKVGEVALDEVVFGVPMRKDIVHEVIRYLRAKKRQPQKSKRLWEISGSNKKPRPQKGQGKSQVGHARNSAWRGGQKAHGPVLRDFSFSLNKKYRAMGMMITLAAKQREGNLIVFDQLACETHRTKDLADALVDHGVCTADGNERVLVADLELDHNFEVASRNLKNITFVVVDGAHVINVVKNDKLVVSAAALTRFQERLRAQYTHKQRRKAYLDGLESIAEAQPSSQSQSDSD